MRRANDGDHIAIIHHIVSVADVPMAGNHVGAAFFVFLRLEERDDLVQRVDQCR